MDTEEYGPVDLTPRNHAQMNAEALNIWDDSIPPIHSGLNQTEWRDLKILHTECKEKTPMRNVYETGRLWDVVSICKDKNQPTIKTFLWTLKRYYQAVAYHPDLPHIATDAFEDAVQENIHLAYLDYFDKRKGNGQWNKMNPYLLPYLTPDTIGEYEMDQWMNQYEANLIQNYNTSPQDVYDQAV